MTRILFSVSLLLIALPARAYTVTPIPIDEQCQFDTNQVVLSAAHQYVDEHAAQQVRLDRERARFFGLKALHGQGGEGFSRMIDCAARRGADLYLDDEGTHRLDPQGRDLVEICETYVIDRARIRWREAADAVADSIGVEMIESPVCTGQ